MEATGVQSIEEVSLEYREGSSDKVYHLQLIEYNDPVGFGVTKLYKVDFQFGRRGSTLNTGTKIQDVDKATAVKAFNKVQGEKRAKGYQVMAGKSNGAYATPVADIKQATAWKASDGSEMSMPPRKFGSVKVASVLPQLCNPIEESQVSLYLYDDRFGMQPKMDGKHFVFEKRPEGSQATNKKGTVCGFPSAFDEGLSDVMQATVDGEGIGDTLYAFDLFELDGEDLRGLGYKARYDKLAAMKVRPGVEIVPLAIGYAEKKKMYDKLLAEDKEGVVFKKLDGVYTPGRPSAGGDFIKFKFYSELSARVCAGRPGKNSIGLELLDDKGVWQFRGYCTVAASKMPIPMGSVAEIRYLYVAGQEGHLYQPAFKEIRDDVDEKECTAKQIKFKPEED